MQYRAKHSDISAYEVTRVDNGEREMIVDGVGVFAVAVFHLFYEPVAAAAPVPERKKPGRKPGRKSGLKPVPAAKKRGRPKKQAPAIALPEEPRKLTITDAIRLAIHEKPRTNQEILERLRELAVDTDSSTVSTICGQLRNKNEILKRDEDYRWTMAAKAKGAAA